MELIPTLISLCGFGIAITFVTIAHKVITNGEKAVEPATRSARAQSDSTGQTTFIHKHAAAH